MSPSWWQTLPGRLVRHWQPLALFVITLGLVFSSALPGVASLALAQIPGTSSGGGPTYSLGAVELDGQDAFQVAAPGGALAQRQQQIQQNLQEIRDRYLSQDNPTTTVSIQESADGQPQVYVNDQYLMTITQQDATLLGTTPSGRAQQLEQTLAKILSRADQQRQPEYRQRQYWQVGIAALVAVGAMIAVSVSSRYLTRAAMRGLGASLDQETMTASQQHQIQDLRTRLMPLVQAAILVGTLLWAIGQFPETRPMQQDLLSSLKVPIIIGIVVVVAYIGIRISYAVIDRVALGISDDGFSHSRRTRLRVSTLSSVTKNIANFVWLAIGLLVALSITGVDLGLLLASVGIIGLALSLATQNLVQGAIKGFFIVLEDQFAIGDVVKIGDHAGLVEKLNLRITQLRDTEGRLITIPTSDINRVANYSLHWSQADLKIPVHYNANIDHMLTITRQVGEELRHDADWGGLILEDPQILGVDDFGDSAVIIRVWIKTQPLKQWDVSREYRRRFKQAVQDSGTTIPFPQRDVWLHPSEAFRQTLQGSLAGEDRENGHHANGNGQYPSAKTDPQPSNMPDNL